MSDALATLTKEAVTLTYEEQRELLRVLSVSVGNIEKQHRRKLDFDSYVIPCERANFAESYVEELRSNDRV